MFFLSTCFCYFTDNYFLPKVRTKTQDCKEKNLKSSVSKYQRSVSNSVSCLAHTAHVELIP